MIPQAGTTLVCTVYNIATAWRLVCLYLHI